MAVILLLFLFAFSFSSGYKTLDDDVTTRALALPTEYHLKAEKIDLVEHIREPLELWFSVERNRSRISVFQGMVTRYYHWTFSSSKDGVVYTISPTTSKWAQNKKTCFVKIIKRENQDHEAFPTHGSYVFAGDTHHEGRKVGVWEDLYEDNTLKIENVLYTYKGSRDVDVPVQIVKKMYLVKKGILSKHVIYNYYDYNPVKSLSDLEIDKAYKCLSVPVDFHGTLKSLHPSFDGDLDVAFDSFKKHHGRDYEEEEHETRKQIFHKNWKFVEERNRMNLGYKLALNHLSDFTDAEMRRMSGSSRSSPPTAPVPFPHSAEEVEEIVQELPEEFDLRLEGYISPIKNQGICGSCWAFSATAAVEGALSRALGTNLVLSEQSLVDCSWRNGCEGGSHSQALVHVMKHGLPLDEEYGGYLGRNGYCHLTETEPYKIRNITRTTPGSVAAAKLALHKYGPLAVVMQTTKDFQFYASGVFYDPKCKNHKFNHAVNIVGYGIRDDKEYWIVRNSWGETWGEVGYMLLSINNKYNCFVLDVPYVAIV